MSDYCRATIEMPADVITQAPELKKLIMDYIESSITANDGPVSWESILEQEGYEPTFSETSVHIFSLHGRLHFSMTDEEARYGYFEDIESWCAENQVPFNRTTYGNYEADSDYMEWYRPGMEDNQVTPVVADVPVMNIDDLRRLIDESPEEMESDQILDNLCDKINQMDPRSAVNSILLYV